MMAQICVTMTSYLHSADVMEIALMYFVHDEINMIPCTVGRLFSRIRYQNPQILKPLKSSKISRTFTQPKSSCVTSKLYD